MSATAERWRDATGGQISRNTPGQKRIMFVVDHGRRIAFYVGSVRFASFLSEAGALVIEFRAECPRPHGVYNRAPRGHLPDSNPCEEPCRKSRRRFCQPVATYFVFIFLVAAIVETLIASWAGLAALTAGKATAAVGLAAVLHFLIQTENRCSAGLPIRTCFFPKNMWAIWPAKSPRN